MSYRNQPRGADGRWIKGKAAGGVVGAALVAGLMAAAGGGDVTASVGAALDTAVSQSTVDAETASSRQAAAKGDETGAWQRMGLKELKKPIKRELRCAVQSFGQVQQFFLRHPCDKLDQLLFVVGDAQGDTIVGTVMWVKMPSKSAAAEFRRVEDTYGSGDVTPLGTEVLELGGVRFTGKHYKSRPDGSLVVVAETEPVRGRPSNTLLKEVATVADVLPPP
ncbi:MAG TPA: hypothetical protein VEO01_10145 [Pseudonocardiaceae bacterium]|nr:hypothetical protein [Pseudonocardiaceae bacterium]